MGMEISFSLDEHDLAHFRRLFQAARQKAGSLDEAATVRAARALAGSSRAGDTPEFVRLRLDSLGLLIDMLQDDGWRLPQRERQRVVDLLHYVVTAHDAIPDATPIFGLLDDAIAIEMALLSLRHEIEMYREFVAFRESERQRRSTAGSADPGPEKDWLSERRARLHARIRDRQAGDTGGWHTITHDEST